MFLIFLKRYLVFLILLFSSISLHCSLKKAFLSFLAILWNSAFRWLYLSFSPLPFTSLLFSAISKASSEENNRMGKTRDLFKKIRDTKGTVHAKMGTIKDRNSIDLTEAEDIKRWQEYTEELYKKDLNDPDNHDGVITHLEPDILECEVKWALGCITMNKASGGDGIQVELFQI